MTWPAALSGAALRVLRTAAGRRALQVAVLVGGLFALGFLCGEQAHAAEGTTPMTSVSSSSSTATASASASTTSSASAVPSAAVDGVRSLTKGATGTKGTVGRLTPDKPVVRPAGHRVAASVREALAHPVTEAVTQPVGTLMATVTAGLAETRTQVPPLPSLPALSALPAAPSLPGLPPLPGKTLPAPVTTAPQPAGSADIVSSGGRTEHPAPTDSYGPRPAVDGIGIGTDTGTAADITRHRPVHAAPAYPAPTGDPNGALVNQSALDNGTSRHGDAHAVPPSLQAPLRLVPGTAARADAAGTRDRYRDIPVFPA
ncbi:hypothetical protein ABZY09_22510 [Streptomyces sp. NPDC002928]|uniref:hypothetical protein n=1 Tax=Streptomyces sp. NPDC002928 TaxID=3154440 RepID=UPI0033B3D8E4